MLFHAYITAILPVITNVCCVVIGNVINVDDDKSDGSINRRQCSPEDSDSSLGGHGIINDKLNRLRQEMRTRTTVLGAELDAYIVPSYDEHQSDIPSDRDRRLRFISEFSGSEGVAAITMKTAALWVDERYRLQADYEITCHWKIMHTDDIAVPTLPHWLAYQLRREGNNNRNGAYRVGADARLVPHHEWEQWRKLLEINNITLVDVLNNLVDVVWSEQRPPPSAVQVYPHHKEYAGKSWQTKVTELRRELSGHGIDAIIVTALDEVAWLMNIRGKDLPYSPLTKAYLVVTRDQIHLYIDEKKLSISAKSHLHIFDSCYNSNCTKSHPYDSIWGDLKTLSQGWRSVLIPAPCAFSTGASEKVFDSVRPQIRMYKVSPIIHMKAVKNEQEIAAMRTAQIRDSAAMCEILAYIEQRMQYGEKWDELKVVREVDLTRKSQHRNKGLSFPTIAGYGQNGALPHYHPTNSTSQQIGTDSTLVLDSGGQYLEGTTDVTRTLHYGSPSQDEIQAYTLVLMATIDLATMVFPADVKANDLDIMARQVLWKHRENYLHSTGHGIGAFLNAHEDPIQIAYGQHPKTVFKPGYFFSNEPAYYEEGKFGVRLENILEVVEAFGGKPDEKGNVYLTFQDATLVPYEPKLIDFNMMTLYQRQWYNMYNSRIRRFVGAELKKQMNMASFYWMMNKTVSVPEVGTVSIATITTNMPLLIIVLCTILYIYYD